MNLPRKNWVLRYERPEGESLWTSLMKARAIQDPGQFFSSAAVEDLHDPFLFKDMAKAVERLQKAIREKERIVVYGDYDVDGISGSAILIHTLKQLGAEVSYRTPHRREEGYGLHAHHIEELAEKGVTVLITVDLGISCAKEVALAQSRGIDVIITDHHTISAEIPEAFAILHPKVDNGYPFHDLSGSGVAFKLASALWQSAGQPERILDFTDLASLGTVADCVPLVGENRTLVKLGLEQMQGTRWDGLRAILKTASADGPFSTYTIGFQIGPRLNASGRMDNPYWALQTLLASGPEAAVKAQKLEELNHERQTLTEQMLLEAEAALDLEAPLLIATGKGWSSGLVGLIAGRLQEKYGKPTFILEDQGDTLTGSARSMPGFHAVEALRQVQDLLEKFGGHEQAAGFHLKKEHFPAFQEGLLRYAEAVKVAEIPRNTLVDCVLRAEDFSVEAAQKAAQLAPFGIGNASPLFLLEDARIVDWRPVGREHRHLKFTAQIGDRTVDGIGFNWMERQLELSSATRLLVQLETNTWNDKTTVQVKLVDC